MIKETLVKEEKKEFNNLRTSLAKFYIVTNRNIKILSKKKGGKKTKYS